MAAGASTHAIADQVNALALLAAARVAGEGTAKHYRLAGLLDNRLATIDKGIDNYYVEYQKGIEEYATECAISKVFCSDVLARVVDDPVRLTRTGALVGTGAGDIGLVPI